MLLPPHLGSSTLETDNQLAFFSGLVIILIFSHGEYRGQNSISKDTSGRRSGAAHKAPDRLDYVAAFSSHYFSASPYLARITSERRHRIEFNDSILVEMAL